MMVGLVDEKYVGRSLPQGAGRRKTAKAPAHDDDSGFVCRRIGSHGKCLRMGLVEALVVSYSSAFVSGSVEPFLSTDRAVAGLSVVWVVAPVPFEFATGTSA